MQKAEALKVKSVSGVVAKWLDKNQATFVLECHATTSKFDTKRAQTALGIYLWSAKKQIHVYIYVSFKFALIFQGLNATFESAAAKVL